MDEFFDLPTLIVIGLAIVILFRLRSVLGTRTGNERSPLQRRSEATAKANAEENVVQMRPRPIEAQPDENAERQARRLASEIEQYSDGNAGVAEGLKSIAEADPSFSPKTFLEGAKMAYEMIVMSFADGDRKALKTLLSKEVYEGFVSAISEREARGEKVNSSFVGIDKADIVGAEMKGGDAHVTVRIVSQLISATLDKEGKVIEGDPDSVAEIKDVWTFARDTRSRDPNWKLVATEAED